MDIDKQAAPAETGSSRETLLSTCSATIAPDTCVGRATVAAKLGLSIRTLDRWAVDGDGPPMIAIGRRRLYRWGDVLSWLDGRRVAHTSALSTGLRGRSAA